MIARVHAWEESPDSKGRVLGNAQAERSDTSATEKIPPMAATKRSFDADQVRVKWWSKSPPRSW